MASCSGIRADGGRCRGIAGTGSEWCPAHDPARREARKRAASKAAKAKGRANGAGEIQSLKEQLAELYADAREDRIPAKTAAVAAQIQNVRLRALALERDIHQQEELAERIEELERVAEERGWAV